MLHLLPEEHKKKVFAEYRKRLGIVTCLFAVSLSVAGIILLIPSYMVAYDRYAEVVSKKQSTDSKISTMSNDTTGDIVKSITNTAIALAPLGATQNATDVFTKLFSEVGTGVRIIHLSYLLNTDGTLTLNVAGTASTRDNLIAFAGNLTRSNYFTGAIVPLSSLRSDKDIGFEFKLGVKK